MGAILGGIPLMGLAIVVVELGASDPATTFVVALVCLIPLGILYALHRLFTKFRLSVFSDGAVVFTQPFKMTKIAPGQIATMNWSSTVVHASNRRMNWLVLGDAKGDKIEAISPISFSEGALQEFAAAVKKTNPNVLLTGL